MSGWDYLAITMVTPSIKVDAVIYKIATTGIYENNFWPSFQLLSEKHRKYRGIA